MSNIVITVQAAQKCVLVDFGALYGNPAFPFINAPRTYFFKGQVARVSPFDTFVRVVTIDGQMFDLAPSMVDTIDGTPIGTMAELEAGVVDIINNNLV